jgi:hypothetical protein
MDAIGGRDIEMRSGTMGCVPILFAVTAFSGCFIVPVIVNSLLIFLLKF